MKKVQIYLITLLLIFLNVSSAFAVQSRTKFNVSKEVKKALRYIGKGRLEEGCKRIILIHEKLSKKHKSTKKIDFPLALCYQKQNKPAKAIKYFKEILDEDPDLVRVRLELALSYYLNKQFRKSEKEFQKILSIRGLPGEVRKNVVSFLDKIKQQKSWGGSISIGYMHDDNVNVGTDAETISFNDIPLTLSESSKPEKDRAYKTSLSLFKTFIFNKNLDFTLAGGYYSTNYQDYGNKESVDGNIYDLVVTNLMGKSGIDLGDFYINLSSSYIRVELDETKIEDIYDSNTDIYYAINKNFVSEVTIGYKIFDYTEESINEGYSYYSSAGLKYKIFNKKGGLAAYLLPYYYREKYDLQEEYISYRSHQYGIRYLQILPYSATFFFDASRSYSEYFEIDSPFGVKRDSTSTSLSSSLSKQIKQIKGLSVSLAHGYTRQESEISLYEYDKHQYTFSISKSF